LSDLARIGELCDRRRLVYFVDNPGLDSHPQHERAKALFRGAGRLLALAGKQRGRQQ
jgi:cystathionine beta-lyase/cystathionine gamma-synthase